MREIGDESGNNVEQNWKRKQGWMCEREEKKLSD